MESLGNSFTIIIVIILAGVLMFAIPLYITAEKTDDVVKLTVQTATTEFANNVRTIGKLKQQDYDNFLLTLGSTNNAYDVEITVQVLDDNHRKKANSGALQIGDNVYYTMYTTQVLGAIDGGKTLELKEGDIFSVAVKLKSKDFGTTMKNFFFRVTGDESKGYIAQESGMVTSNSAR